jgi:phosphoglycerol transferase MdoB-like AlkP superfamily enzyme
VFKWIGIAIGLLVAALVGFIVAAVLLGADFRAAWRDVFIVILAALQLIGAIVTIALLVALLFMVHQLDKVARTTIMPRVDDTMVKLNDVLDSTRTLAGNVRDSSNTAVSTTTYVSERVVSPVIRISSLVTGVRTAAQTLARRGQSEEPTTTDVA